MAVLKILTYPEPSLLKPSEKVDNIDDEIRHLVQDMGETMFDAPGIGLAAPQIGVNKRIIVYDINAGKKEDEEEKKNKQEYKALINPRIIQTSGSIVSADEGCLSVIDYNADVKRYETVTVRAVNMKEEEIEFDAQGILAVIMQHEIDHLDGILFIDRISILKRSMYKKKIKKQLKKS